LIRERIHAGPVVAVARGWQGGRKPVSATKMSPRSRIDRQAHCPRGRGTGDRSKTTLYAALKTEAEGNTPASKQVVRGSFT
jgi:hypothetical protein